MINFYSNKNDTITKKTRTILKILAADFILTCSDDFKILENEAICFDEKIIEIGKLEDLRAKYPSSEVEILPPKSVIMPGLINPHVHLEFSANKSTLHYGDFITWLNSIISHRDDLLLDCSDETISHQLEIMRRSGTTSLGAISSFGNDFEACAKSPQRVVFFTEILGSRPDSVDVLFSDFKSRLRAVEDSANDRLIPAISIHSAYSTHPILARNALDIARCNKYPVSTHFMESVAEREWLDSASGDFSNFFASFAPNSKPMSSAYEYIELFRDCNALFTHCVQANMDELQAIKNIGGVVTHCIVSNRLLGVGKLNLKKLQESKVPLTLGTDGLSSNISLNLWDEMRAFIYSHEKEEINTLAKLAIKATTKNSAKALKIDAGELNKGKLADIIVCKLPKDIKSVEDIPLALILHTKYTKKTYINGELI